MLGSDTVSHICLNAMTKELRSRITVLCPPPTSNPKTPLSLFHQYVKDSKIPIIPFQGDWNCVSNDFNISFVASFGHMVPDHFIDKFDLGMYVMHPSLLPKYRGACPI